MDVLQQLRKANRKFNIKVMETENNTCNVCKGTRSMKVYNATSGPIYEKRRCVFCPCEQIKTVEMTTNHRLTNTKTPSLIQKLLIK